MPRSREHLQPRLHSVLPAGSVARSEAARRSRRPRAWSKSPACGARHAARSVRSGLSLRAGDVVVLPGRPKGLRRRGQAARAEGRHTAIGAFDVRASTDRGSLRVQRPGRYNRCLLRPPASAPAMSQRRRPRPRLGASPRRHSRAVTFGYDRDRPVLTGSTCDSAAARWSRSWAVRAPARRRCCA